MVYVQVLKKDDGELTTQVLGGCLVVVYGLTIYYFLPISLMELNLQLILMIFFLILLGMLVGLTLLTSNLQRVLEIIMTHVLLVFEKKSYRDMVLKNLSAHKLRNKLTSLIFAMALGFVIFLIVSYNL